MEKLAHVHQALQENSEIRIVGVVERRYSPEIQSIWSHTVDFYLAPRTGGVYTVEGLQVMMLALVPSLAHDQCDDFRDRYREREIEFGRLYFDEDIENPSLCAGGATRLRRRIWVRVFPNIAIAQDALGGVHKYCISKSDLATYQ